MNETCKCEIFAPQFIFSPFLRLAQINLKAAIEHQKRNKDNGRFLKRRFQSNLGHFCLLKASENIYARKYSQTFRYLNTQLFRFFLQVICNRL